MHMIAFPTLIVVTHQPFAIHHISQMVFVWMFRTQHGLGNLPDDDLDKTFAMRLFGSKQFNGFHGVYCTINQSMVSSTTPHSRRDSEESPIICRFRPFSFIPMIANIAAYKFVALEDRETLRETLRSRCVAVGLKGTVLLASEGINLFLAGEKQAVDDFLALLKSDLRLADIEVKWSWSDFVPFKRLRVKLKNEIVSFRTPGFNPVTTPAPVLTPAELKRWYDEGRDFVIIDTRNDWEFQQGTFDNAINPKLNNFCEFPKATPSLEELKQKTVVTFCTGGIRCEKAAPLLQQQGFKEVYQLQGGILKYFDECGGAHWTGNCVVFDERGTLDPQLRPVVSAA